MSTNTNKKIEILKAKLRDNLFVTATYAETVGNDLNNVTIECSAPAHDDLRRAFRQLTPHLALIAEQINLDNKSGRQVSTADDANAREALMDPDRLFTMSDENWAILVDMECTGFSIGGSGDNEGVTLIGKRELSTNKTLNLTAPFTKWDDSMPYRHSSDLAELIETCKAEVYSYLFEGKHQPDAQMSFAFPEDTDQQQDKPDEIPNAAVAFEKPKLGRKPKSEGTTDTEGNDF